MKYQFYTIGFDEIFGSSEVYGVAFNKKTEVCWTYDMETKKGVVDDGIVDLGFFPQLQEYIESIHDELMEGVYEYSEERELDASMLLYENELRRNRGRR